MRLAKRFLFYFSGFAIGLILLYFFVGGSGASCEYDYGPNARTLKNIRNKEQIYSEQSLRVLSDHQLDTSAISEVLRSGNVLFSKSNTRLDSCKVYVIEGVSNQKALELTMENCDAKATLSQLIIR